MIQHFMVDISKVIYRTPDNQTVMLAKLCLVFLPPPGSDWLNRTVLDVLSKCVVAD